SEVLLGLKKVRFGAGKWNGFGGKVEKDESLAAAAARELREEASLETQPHLLQKIADISFYFAEKPIFQCHTFIARDWQGEPQESDEMRPQWWPLDALPWDLMWPSDFHWLPGALGGSPTHGTVWFDEAGKTVKRFEISTVADFEALEYA
ncbi:MAG TPA: NUDIX domain-containing protein, partial [Candidatus Paceibacterota bacterium]|nr:NUDIX domain-containing protein [Candidatus Paceibacterota bacterium]